MCLTRRWQQIRNQYLRQALYASSKAQAGNFEEAVKWQEKAIELGYPDKQATEDAGKRLKLYGEGKPFRVE
jgi:hypothetical protein